MAKTKIVITSRGNKLDMDGLKKSKPNIKRLVINKNKNKVVANAKIIPTAARPRRINATIPAPVPINPVSSEVSGTLEQKEILHVAKKRIGKD